MNKLKLIIFNNMKQNEHLLDRIIRVIIALGLLYVGITNNISNGIRLAIAVVGGILIVTAVVGYCPLYSLLGISTRKQPNQNQETEENTKSLESENKQESQ